MPATHVVPVESESKVHIVRKNGHDSTRSSLPLYPVHTLMLSRLVEFAQIMQRRPGEVYVHYLNTDKRMDEWVRESDCRLQTATPPPLPSAPARRGRGGGRGGRGGRASTAARDVEMAPPLPEPLLPPHPTENGTGQTERIISEEDYDLQHHKQLTAQRNFDMVVFDSWKIKPW